MVSGTSRIMWTVNAALLPGFAVLSFHFGTGYLQNIAIAWPLACALDWMAAKARGRPANLGDGSVTLTALILALALPPAAAWHVVTIATGGAVLLARQLYGGLGHNIFNPAMAGYAIALVSYPLAMGTWPPLVDGATGATALTALKYRDGLTVAEAFRQNPAFGHFGGRAWEWANLAFAAGGLWLLLRGLIAWRVVAAFLITLGALALMFNDGGSSSGTGPPLSTCSPEASCWPPSSSSPIRSPTPAASRGSGCSAASRRPSPSSSAPGAATRTASPSPC